jgi:hypothetical protein
VTADYPPNIYELNHDGTLVRTLSDPFGFPAGGCAWDPTTGNLAVTNINRYCCSGTVLIYPGGSGTPSQFGDPYGRLYHYVGYDSRGNLYFDGEDLNYQFLLGELPKGGKVRTIDVSGGKIVWPGMVQSAGPSALYIGDQTCKDRQQSCLHLLALKGSNAKITGEIDLFDGSGQALCNTMQGIVWGGHLFGSDYQTCNTNASATYVWRVPAGGNPQSSSSNQEFAPFGAAISV